MSEFISNKTIERLKHDLVRSGMLTLEDLSRAEVICENNRQNLAQVLIDEEFINEDILLKFIQDNLHIPYVNLDDYSIDRNCLDFISADNALKYNVIPLFRIENVLTIAMSDPLDLFAINNIVKCLKCQVEPVICSERLIELAIEKYYFENKNEKQETILEWTEQTGEENIVKSIISQGISQGIFEVIIEDINVKYRENNSIKEIGVIPRLLAPLVVSYLKNMSGLDASVFDIPQLGKFKYEDVTAVVSTFPCLKGERITIKFYRSPKTLKDLKIDINLEEPGLILVCGQEGCGKSFVAYSILNSIDSGVKSIMTIESIAKYEIEGVIQCEFNEKVGFNIEKALKFIDFQSPDVIYIEDLPSGELLKFIKNGKLIITEINEENITNELMGIAKYIVYVKNPEDITVKDLLKG